MIVYMAGGWLGNLKHEFMKIYLAGKHSVKDNINIYLAKKNESEKICEQYIYDSKLKLCDLNILESFYYLRKNLNFTELIPHINSFLLDSGAFTFMQGNHNGEINWDRYIEEYGNFIKKYNIELFFELDIDSLVAISEVERLRDKLQDITGKPPIPVWHKNRGKEYFVQMCQKYPYVAIGGIVTKEIKRNDYEKLFPWFINTAHKYGAKIHGLGYTSLEKLKMYHFDSVDSTTWLYGNRIGWVEKFNPSTGLMDRVVKKGYKIKPKKAAINNFVEWVKLSKYAELYY